ncbi:ABC transporter permease [Marinovum sp.]|uniref:ABC transporter permease n=1 Tax=Marinovum sp. TaxID=2024839 RepID=UPI002B26E918|nr:ABC transporter permease [Marinovum sp.]
MTAIAITPPPAKPRIDPGLITGALPFVVLITLWALAPTLSDIPAYKLPSPMKVWTTFTDMLANGSLLPDVWASLKRLAVGYLLGNLIAIPLGLAIALNRAVAETLTPVLSFFQSIAGIAWVPLAIIWFGVGQGSVLFVIANTIFFASIYSTVIGVQSIPQVLYRAALSHGASRWDVVRTVVVPGALVQILVGLRTSMAYGWRALVAAEMIAGSDGIGYMTLEAVQWYQTEIVILGMILIGILWLLLDYTIFRPIEKVTVRRWGLMS